MQKVVILGACLLSLMAATVTQVSATTVDSLKGNVSAAAPLPVAVHPMQSGSDNLSDLFTQRTALIDQANAAVNTANAAHEAVRAQASKMLDLFNSPSPDPKEIMDAAAELIRLQTVDHTAGFQVVKIQHDIIELDSHILTVIADHLRGPEGSQTISKP